LGLLHEADESFVAHLQWNGTSLIFCCGNTNESMGGWPCTN
jgi:hypothetical protein